MTNNSSPSHSAGRADVRETRVAGNSSLKGAFPTFVCKKRVPGDLIFEHGKLRPKIELIARTPQMAAAVIAELESALGALRKARDTALSQLNACTSQVNAAEAQIEELRSECEVLQQENEQLAAQVGVPREEGETLREQLTATDDTASVFARFDSESLARNAAEHLDETFGPTQSNDAPAASAPWGIPREQQPDGGVDAELLARLVALNEKRDAAKRALRL